MDSLKLKKKYTIHYIKPGSQELYSAQKRKFTFILRQLFYIPSCSKNYSFVNNSKYLRPILLNFTQLIAIAE